MKPDEINVIINAFYDAYKVPAIREGVTIVIGVGSEVDRPSCYAELRTAHGHDGKSIELKLSEASVNPKHQNMMGGEGSATSVIENNGATLLGCALIAFAKAVEELEVEK